jgi:1-acyl-sn-glycerol-3-phosphate acyltransferase
MTVFRSALFMLWFVLETAFLAIVFSPVLVLPRKAAAWLAWHWCEASLWGLRVFAGLDYEVRGTPPRAGVLVASKHMTMWDTLALYYLLRDPAMIFKRELKRVPFYGWYLWKSGMISIDRAAGASALRHMAQQGRQVIGEGRPVLIFPEGTRKKPGLAPDYKPGVAGLYGQLDVPCVPVALNSGLYWTGPGGFLKKRGTVIVEFLPPIPPGLNRRDFMATLEQRVETATNGLLAEGRHQLEITPNAARAASA